MKNCRLDWALIMPKDEARIGSNRLPHLNELPGVSDIRLGDFPVYARMQRTNPAQVFLGQPMPASTFPHKRMLYKVGASTRTTAGILSCYQSKVSMNEDAYLYLDDEGKPSDARFSTEYMFVSARDESKNPGQTSYRLPRFTGHGDSGSAVWDDHGKLVGLAFTGRQPKVTENGGSIDRGRAYVTPISEIFRDIVAYSKGAVTHIRVAHG